MVPANLGSGSAFFSPALAIQTNPTLTLSPASLPAAAVNVPYGQFITATGGIGTANLAVTGFQSAVAGLNVASSGIGSLVISGTPTLIGAEGFSVTATDSLGDRASGNYSIAVNSTISAVSLSPASLPAGSLGTLYNQSIVASGIGSVSLTVSNLAGAIPGLSVLGSGTGTLTISGVPASIGTEAFTVTAIDSAGDQASGNYVVRVNNVNSALTLVPATLPAATVDVAYSHSITASGGFGSVSLAVSNVAGAIPGLNVSGGGTGVLTISGVPTSTGTETLTVTASDLAGDQTSGNYSISVNRPTANTFVTAQQMPSHSTGLRPSWAQAIGSAARVSLLSSTRCRLSAVESAGPNSFCCGNVGWDQIRGRCAAGRRAPAHHYRMKLTLRWACARYAIWSHPTL